MKINFQEDIEVIKTIFAIILIMLSILITLSFISFYIYWYPKQNEINTIFYFNNKTNNLIGYLGEFLGHFFIQKRFGLSSFLIPITLLLIGIKILINKTIIKTWKYILHSLFISIWLPIFCGYFNAKNFIFSGIYGFQLLKYCQNVVGNFGTFFLLIISFLIYIILIFKISSKNFKTKIYIIHMKFYKIKNNLYNNIKKKK